MAYSERMDMHNGMGSSTYEVELPARESAALILMPQFSYSSKAWLAARNFLPSILHR